MAFKIGWTPPAVKGFNKIIAYLEENWTEREVSNFVKEVNGFIKVLATGLKFFSIQPKTKICIAGH